MQSCCDPIFGPGVFVIHDVISKMKRSSMELAWNNHSMKGTVCIREYG